MQAETIETLIQQAATTQLSRADVQQILDGLAGHLGLDQLKLDQDGAAELVIDDELPLTLIHLEGFPGVLLHAPMPDQPEHRGPLLRYLLQANMSWALTGGGAFAMGPDGELALCRHLLLADRDLERIDRELATFADQATGWIEHIELYLDAIEDFSDAELAAPPPASTQVGRGQGAAFEDGPGPLSDRFV
jgi:hypothetical protein